MYNQVYQFFSEHELFYKSQYGFRRKHSTELAALELTDRILTEMDQYKCPISIYMDLSKAFDTLDHQILLKKLKHYGFFGKSLDMMKSYLTNRTQYVEYNGVASEFSQIQCGVPQGSILGPLLFIIYMNDLPNVAEKFEMILYADDTTLFAALDTGGSNLDNINLLNGELDLVSTWLKVNKLSLNAAKTKGMLFHAVQRKVTYPELYIDAIKIEFVKTFKFLGLTLDENMNWNSHINIVSNKISRAIGVMARLKNYIPKSALLQIYNALVLSHLNYGLIVWSKKSEVLIKLQKKAIRITCNVKYNAHTSPLFKRENLLKFVDICALDDLKFCYKFVNKQLPKYFDKLPTEEDESEVPYDTRQSDDLRVPAVRHEFARNSISYRYPNIYNDMSSDYKDRFDTHSFYGFKFYVKRTIIESYPTSCDIRNCPSC